MSDEITAQLAELEALEQEEARQQKQDEQLKRLELLKLKKASAAKYGGREGVAFNIVDTPAGFFVFHKVEGVIAKKLRKSEMSDPDVEEFVKAHLEKEDTERFTKAI